MSRHIFCLFCLFFLFLNAQNVWCYEPLLEEKKLQEIVSAARHETIFSQEPGTLSVITAKDIEILNPPDLLWVLRYLPGVLLEYTSTGYANIILRGGVAMFPPISILLDGRPYNIEAIGITVWPFLLLDPSEIERIELVRTPASVHFGSNAVTGAINVVTKTPEEIRKNKINVILGTQSYRKEIGIFKEEFSPWHIYAFLGHEHMDDYEQDKLNMERLMARLSAARLTKLGTARIDIGLYHGDLNNLYHLNLFNIGQGTILNAKNVNHWGARISLEGPSYFLRFSNFLADGYLDFSGLDVKKQYYKQGDYLIEAEKTFYFYKQRLNLGLNVEYVTVNADFLDNEYQTRFAFFGEDFISLNKKVSLIVGARINYNPISDFFISPRISSIINLSNNLSFRYTFTKSFGNPTILFSNINVKNFSVRQQNYPYDLLINIQKESDPDYLKQDAHEITINIKNGKNYLLISGFIYNLKNIMNYESKFNFPQIEFIPVKYKKEIKGFDIEYKHRTSSNINLRLNYEYTYVKNKTLSITRKEFPRHLLSGLLIFRNKKISSYIGANYISEKEENNILIKDLFYLDMGLNYQINKNFKLSMQILNALKETNINTEFGTKLDRRIFVGIEFKW
ncbi:TonB-dependent receptor plug domain-containing protein [Thermodesulfatator atlanticus]